MPRVAVGFVLVVLFSAAVVVLTFNVVFNFGKGLLWMRHGDEHLRSSMGNSDIEKQLMPSNSHSLTDGNASEEKTRTAPTDESNADGDALARTLNVLLALAHRHNLIHDINTPDMSEAISPGFTIPSADTSEDGDTSTFRSAPPGSVYG